ncbi:hypothetical protein [Desulfovirgula thermocuniculi]|uniref:hypothetical protein n=1 Tax=Desulfovirgula thermocuniculi TaxID=348842 RepID=UPI00041F0AB1|nr:hypothetical protein [Desulfovirgula thermocuniculi]
MLVGNPDSDLAGVVARAVWVFTGLALVVVVLRRAPLGFGRACALAVLVAAAQVAYLAAAAALLAASGAATPAVSGTEEAVSILSLVLLLAEIFVCFLP